MDLAVKISHINLCIVWLHVRGNVRKVNCMILLTNFPYTVRK